MRGIRWRLTLTHLGATFLSTVALGVCLLYAVERSYVQERRQVLSAHSELVSEALLNRARSGDERSAQEVCDELSRRLRTRIVLTSVSGSRIADTARDDSPFVAPADQSSRSRFGCLFCHSETEGARQLQVTTRLPPSARAELLTLMAPSTGLEHTMQRIRIVVAAMLAASLLLISVIGVRLASSIASPITRMSCMARRMAEGDLEQRVRVDSRDEVGELAASFNEMADRIHRTMNALAEEKSKLETVVTDMADGIIVTDAGGRVTLFNPASERIFGVGAAAVLDTLVYEATANPDLQRAVARALDGESVATETRVGYPARMVLGTHVSPIRDAAGKARGAIVVLQDRTELSRVAELQRDFVANVSHELRTPIASIHATAETLVNGAKDDPAVRDRFLDTLARECQRLSALLRDLLDLSRLEARGGSPRKVRVRVGAVVGDVLELLRPVLDRRELRITVSIPLDLHVAVEPTQLTQALANLVDNAVKYTPDGGEIELSAHRSNGRVLVRVRDTGIGIPRHEQERVFERFYRVDKARSRELGGTGLGLAIAREAVEAQQGTITVESHPGRGTAFTVSLPAEPGV
ncbi:MAG: HAMP domain-containing protein [Armatimonadetes bacterium]|nr:HAMP domain-containing protein [Armatimonadota bacterium]